MPVEVDEALALRPGAVVVDATLGLGGHSLMMTEKIGPQGHLIGIDQDEAAIAIARDRLKGFSGRLDIVKSNFCGMDEVLSGLGVATVDAVLFDLGVSSLQFDAPERGFSFRSDGPLDMRMDAQAATTAEDVVNERSEKELGDLIFQYGEERFARRIAQRIVAARASMRIKTTVQLADIVLRSLPKGYQRDRIHPATRTFQALRIAVNRELDVLPDALGSAFSHLKPGGRMAVISFHSLEDRIVKQGFKALARQGSAALLTKRPLIPTDAEAADNPRSRSAKMRALERIM
ncbi:MAG: 16S rRNA (cytosine(1402)-N(4))-methyltransferase RsmH [Candidatus Omnitrophica bacterium]|nr:16S rRNA (cytosine(1402)-N(4))-methyltransferase RsmH [Candidatus Omnitrophota bacterium]